jgi:hypothetical protein
MAVGGIVGDAGGPSDRPKAHRLGPLGPGELDGGVEQCWAELAMVIRHVDSVYQT